MSARTLVQGASQVSDIRFDEFYRLHRTDAVRWATALVGSRELGEDLAQDAFQAVSRKLDGIDNPGGYLRRAVVNRCASWHRWHAGERRRLRLASAGAATSYTAETNEMMDALATLPYNQRAAVTLRYWADWTDDQIGDALGVAPASVRVLLHRGIAALRKEISE
jgi:RNA polymerase sigma factor (sigma-70 family)